MGFRSLIEIDHDDINQIMFDSGQFAKDLARYVASGNERSRLALEYYNVNVVAMRHSADKYIVPSRSSGFPAQMPYGEFQQHVGFMLGEARRLTKGSTTTTKAELKGTIAELVEIIQRLDKGEDTVS